MTDALTTPRPPLRRGRRLWLWLTALGNRRPPAAQLETLSDQMLRDIGVPRLESGRTTIRTQFEAMRYSG